MSEGGKIRVMIVDDIVETRNNLAKLLGFEKDMVIAGMAASGQEAIELANQRAEEKAARAPILIMLPTIGCIFPSLFIVILGPAVLSAMATCGSV